MSRRAAAARPLALVVLLGATLIAGGCGGGHSYPDVSVTTPEVRGAGPTLSMAEWRKRVGAICRRAAVRVTRASAKLAGQVADPSDVGEVSRRAFEMGEPVIERQLRALARLRPPPAIEAGYQDFVSTLADELRWTGRIALMADTSNADDELAEADRHLAASAAKVHRFVGEHSLLGCVPAGSTPP